MRRELEAAKRAELEAAEKAQQYLNDVARSQLLFRRRYRGPPRKRWGGSKKVTRKDRKTIKHHKKEKSVKTHKKKKVSSKKK
jgi:hypothetical protein